MHGSTITSLIAGLLCLLGFCIIQPYVSVYRARVVSLHQAPARGARGAGATWRGRGRLRESRSGRSWCP